MRQPRGRQSRRCTENMFGSKPVKLQQLVSTLRARPVDDAQIKTDLRAALTEPLSAADLFGALPPDDVRDFASRFPRNFAVMLSEVVVQYERLTAALTAKYRDDEAQQLLNCARLLARFVPFALESGFANALLWDGTLPHNPAAPDTPVDAAAGFAAAETDRHGAAGPVSADSVSVSVQDASARADSAAGAASGAGGTASPPLATRLVDSLVQSLFVPNFTVLPAVLNLQGPLRAVWASGLGVATAAGTTTQLDQRRTEILKAILAVLCGPLLCTADQLFAGDRRLLAHAASAACPHSEALFYSLLNTVLAYDPIGWGVPYASFLVDLSPEQLVESACQLLCVLLDFRPQPRAVPITGHAADDSHDPAAQHNVFIGYLQGISGDAHHRQMLAGFARLLGSIVQSQNTYLPGARRTVSCFQELLVLLWKMLELNHGFRVFVSDDRATLTVMTALLVLMYQGRVDLLPSGVLHHATTVLLLLSGDRRVAVQLNVPLTERLPLDLQLNSSSYADLVFLVLHRVAITLAERQDQLIEAVICVLVNVSPYVKSLQMTAATRLVGLAELFATPRFLFANERHPRLLVNVLEILNNFTQYQYEGNGHLIYAIIRKKAVFESLLTIAPSTPDPSPPAREPYDDKGPVVPTPSAAESAPVPASAPAAPAPTLARAVDSTVSSTVVTAAAAEPHGEARETRAALAAADSAATAEAGAVAGGRVADAPKDGPGAVPAPAGVTEGAAATAQAALAQTAAAAAAAARPVWQPTAEWLESWRQRLPLHTLLRLIAALGPPVAALCQGPYIDDRSILALIQRSTMVGLLPVPHRIVVHLFRSNDATDRQVTALLWSLIYVRNVLPPLLYGLRIALFRTSY